VSPEQLPSQPFGPVAFYGVAHLAGGGDAQPGFDPTICHHKHGHEPATDSRAGIVGALEIGPPPHALRPSERLGQRLSLRPRPSGASAPWPGGASARFGRSSSTSAHETRGSWPGGVCLAGRCAYPSSISPSVPQQQRNEPDSGAGRNLNSSEQLPNSKTIWGSGVRVLHSRVLVRGDPASRSATKPSVSSPSFPQLWKRLWKSQGPTQLGRSNPDFAGVS